MEHNTYGYHCSSHMTKPRNTDTNIKGLELEIDDYDSGYLLDCLIDDDVITVPCNESEHRRKSGIITCEDDGSVYKELIFKASCNRTLLKGVKTLNEVLHNQIENGPGTSCHIHINNKYIRKIGLTNADIVKSAEFIAPILFKISGRNKNSYLEWARSIFEQEVNIENSDLYRRATLIEDEGEDIDDYGARYRLINLNKYNTTELRIFSNHYNFDYDYIKMYLETVDFIIDLALYMKDKNYVENYNEALRTVKEFFSKRRYKKIFERHQLDEFFLSEKERRIRNLNKEINYVKNMFDILKSQFESFQLNTQDKAIYLLRALRNYHSRYTLKNIKINIYDINLNEIENKILEKLENELELIE